MMILLAMVMICDDHDDDGDDDVSLGGEEWIPMQFSRNEERNSAKAFDMLHCKILAESLAPDFAGNIAQNLEHNIRHIAECIWQEQSLLTSPSTSVLELSNLASLLTELQISLVLPWGSRSSNSRTHAHVEVVPQASFCSSHGMMSGLSL